MGKSKATGLFSRKQKLNLQGMMFEKMPMLMVLATLMYLACSAYGGTECLKKESDESLEDCHGKVIAAAHEVNHLPRVCDATGCTETITNHQIIYCCAEKFHNPIVEGNGSEKTTCTCEPRNKN